MKRTYDIIVIGGGLAGASFAKVMAERGLKVLVLERETEFKDRVRGEALFPWGAAELEKLGLRKHLLSTCAVENRWWDDFLGTERIGHRDTIEETPGQTATITFYHPLMQETILQAAMEAGAEVRRGVHAAGIVPGHSVKTASDHNGRNETILCRLIAGADGRNSSVRRWAGFNQHTDPPRHRIAGHLFDGMTAMPQDTTHFVINTELGQSSILIPQGNGRVRVYVIYPSRSGRRFSGKKDIHDFIAEAIRTGVHPELFDGAVSAGPLATFEGADSWVESPYHRGVALLGDAASTCDPAWGQGLSMSVRDARVLSDCLLGNENWENAGRTYAGEHNRAYATIHATEDLFSTFFLETGPAADARRSRAFPLIAEEPDRVPDAFMSGPDAAPINGHSRNRFFGEV
jgi:menaquinone-9 beta-reductase